MPILHPCYLPCSDRGSEGDQDASLTCDYTTNLDVMHNVWSRIDVTNVTKSIEMFRPLNLTVLLAMKQYPYSWNDSSNTLSYDCYQHVALWWVAGVQLMQKLGMNISFVELFNEPKCGPLPFPAWGQFPDDRGPFRKIRIPGLCTVFLCFEGRLSPCCVLHFWQ